MNFYCCLLASILFVGASSGAQAASAVHKCVIKGTVTFQQDPCPTTAPRRDPSVDRLNVEEKKLREAAAVASETRPKTASSPAQPTGAKEQVAPLPTPTATYRCDGRTHCSQMSSCSEAKYFLANCPGVKMDGDKNGIPCEQQWCNR